MRIQNTSTTKPIYVSLYIAGESKADVVELKPNEVKNYSSQVGAMKLDIGENKNSALWSGMVPTQVKEPLMLGLGLEPYVTYAGQLIPNTLDTSCNKGWILLLIILIIIIVVALWLCNRKES